MKNILVVGGAGYIGSHNVRKLIKSGFIVTGKQIGRAHV